MSKIELEYRPMRFAPIPKDMNTKGFPKPAFLDQVRTSHFVGSKHIQIRMDYDKDAWQSQTAIEEVKQHFDFEDRRRPRAAKIVHRTENDHRSDIYRVIGVTTMCEGLIFFEGSEEGHSFVTKRKHPVAIIINKLNRQTYALLADLQNLGQQQLYDVWLVQTENVKHNRREDKLKSSGLTKHEAMEYIWFEHADEPSPDRSDYWNYVAVPMGTKPEKYQRRSEV